MKSAKFLLALILSIFVVEGAVMLGLQVLLPDAPHFVTNLLDCVLLIVLITPVALGMTKKLQSRTDELQQKDASYRAIFEESVVGMFQSLPEGLYTRVNPAYADMLKYESPENLVASITDIAQQVFVDPKRRDEFTLALHQQGVIKSFEFEAIRNDGCKVWLRANARAICDADGVLLHYIGAAEDITAGRLLEEHLRQSQKLEAIGQLAGGVAHDFNNLLMVINSYTEMLEEQLAPEDPLRNNTQQVLKATQRAAGLTKQMLTFSRKQVLSPQAVDLVNLVDDTATMLKRLIGEDIELSIIRDQSGCLIKADPSQITQILLNLCVNSRDAMPTGGKLTIETKNVVVDTRSIHPIAGEYVLLSVTDTGLGITTEIKKRMFEPFFTTKQEGKGTGLGLATVYGIVKQSGAFILVDSDPGKGSSFTLYFPKVEQSVTTTIGTAQGVPPASEAGLGETILLVEDEDALREAICEHLTKNGYIVLQAANGERAIELAASHRGRIHLLLTDVIMPKMSGPDLASRLAVGRKMVTLFMSGYTGDTVVSHGLPESGAVLIEKPFSFSVLERRMRELLTDHSSGISV